MKNMNRKSDSELGEFIWKVVHDSGYSKEQIAERLNVSVRTLNYYCSGQRKPAQKKLLQLIKVAEINVEDIPF